MRSGGRGVSAADGLAALSLVALAALYFWQLDGWLINDDEGSYLYAAWRIGLGELPYRDFLTPQLPAFLLPGGLLFGLLGPGAWAARAVAAVLTVATGGLVWATARRLFHPAVAWLAGVGVLLHPLVFADNRTYRPEPFMLFLASLGVLLFTVGAFPRPGTVDPPRRRLLAAAGVAFGLAILTKLFGALPLGAVVLWLATDGWRRGRPSGQIGRDLAALLVPAAVAVIAGIGAFYALSGGAVLDAVLGHHLRQGAGMSPIRVLGKGVGLYVEFVRYDGNALLAFVALAWAVVSWRERRRRAAVFAWHLPTALVFLLITRQLFARHLLYLVPALVTLFALAVHWLYTRAAPEALRTERRLLAGAVAAGLLVPWLVADWHRAWEWEAGTHRAGDFIQLVTMPDDLVLADYSELNFYGRRPTTYSAASLSEGAARSGQITWDVPGAPHRIRQELGQRVPPLVLVDAATEWSQLAALADWDAFQAWLEEGYGDPAGILRRHHQTYRVYVPRDRPLPTAARFASGPSLLAADLTSSTAGPDTDIAVRTAWRAEAPIPSDLVATVLLLDRSGRQWAATDTPLRASGTDGSRVRPTGAWEPGELAADRLPLRVPPGTPPGAYTVWLGLYEPDTLSRLEAEAPDGRALGQRVPVGSLEILASDAGARPARRLDLPIGGGATLLGHGLLPEEPLDAGDTFELDLWWRAARSETDRSVRVLLADAASGAVAADVTARLGVPGTGTSAWPEREILVRQAMRVPILAAAADGSYDLSVTLLDDSGGAVGAAVDLGTLPVRGRNLADVVTRPPPLESTVDAVFGDAIQLLGASGLPDGGAAAVLAPGSVLSIDLVWRAVATPESELKVSLQLLDATGAPVAQSDRMPGEPPRPTTAWLPGEVVVDPHALAVPSELPAGAYRLAVAAYDPETLARLPVAGRDALGDMAVVATAAVEP